MERFTRGDIDRWRYWMGFDGESKHAEGKFSHDRQLRYFCDGVNNPVYSWRTSSLAYFDRAVQKKPLLEVFEGEKLENVKLQISRNLGKSAHNHMVLLVYADVFYRGCEPFSRYSDVIDEVGQGLGILDDRELVKFLELDPVVVAEGEGYYTELQALQDADRYDDLRSLALGRAIYMNSGYLSGALSFGWSLPGSGSTEDVEPWTL